MISRRNHSILSIRSIASNPTTPQSSAYPSAYPSEDDDDDDSIPKQTSFPFLSLPSELRNKIYSLVFAPVPPVVDLDPTTFSLINRQRLLSVFFTSKQVYLEASHHFFSTHTFRLFPTHPGRYFKTKKPLLARLPARYRESITSLELRLGPGWNNPPRGWVVNEALGLTNCMSVRVLKIFVECDPSDGIFKGFRQSDGFYEGFSCTLLENVLKEVPSVKVVEFDAWTSVKRDGDMITSLGEVVQRFDKTVAWGPERGWEEGSEWWGAMSMRRIGKAIPVSA